MRVFINNHSAIIIEELNDKWADLFELFLYPFELLKFVLNKARFIYENSCTNHEKILYGRNFINKQLNAMIFFNCEPCQTGSKGRNKKPKELWRNGCELE